MTSLVKGALLFGHKTVTMRSMTSNQHAQKNLLSWLTTLGQAAGDNKGLKVKVIDEQDKMGKGKGEDAEGK